MADGLVLLHHRHVGLTVGVHALLPVSAHVDEELRFVEVLAVAGHGVELGEGHLGDLVAGHADLLVRPGPDLAAHAVGELDGDVQEIALPRGPVMGHGAFDQVPEVIELVAVLDLHPALRTGPAVRMLGVARPRGVQVAVRLLGRCDDDQDAVDVGLQLRIRIGLQEVRSALDGLIDVRVVEGEPADAEAEVLVGVHLLRRFFEVAVASGLLALREGEGNGDFAGSLQPLAPERVRDLHGREGDGAEGIVVPLRGGACGQRKRQQHGEGGLLHKPYFTGVRR